MSTGPNSRIIDFPTMVPTKYMGTAPVSVYDAWSASTMPVNVAMKSAIGMGATPTPIDCVNRRGPQI